MNQLTFIEQEERYRLARRNDPATSKAAARRAPLNHHEALIMASLKKMGRGTKDDIAVDCGIDSTAVARRMKRLSDRGKVHARGAVRLASGRPGTVWEAV